MAWGVRGRLDYLNIRLRCQTFVGAGTAGRWEFICSSVRLYGDEQSNEVWQPNFLQAEPYGDLRPLRNTIIRQAARSSHRERVFRFLSGRAGGNAVRVDFVEVPEAVEGDAQAIGFGREANAVRRAGFGVGRKNAAPEIDGKNDLIQRSMGIVVHGQASRMGRSANV
ncbi:MAG TPA: hypothetical protein VGH36_08445 [Acetobacteraceae bacterium]